MAVTIEEMVRKPDVGVLVGPTVEQMVDAPFGEKCFMRWLVQLLKRLWAPVGEILSKTTI